MKANRECDFETEEPKSVIHLLHCYDKHHYIINNDIYIKYDRDIFLAMFFESPKRNQTPNHRGGQSENAFLK